MNMTFAKWINFQWKCASNETWRNLDITDKFSILKNIKSIGACNAPARVLFCL